MQHHEFPKFVPDQLLTSDHLNQVFNYLDEQERLTRTCLIGIGIVCGLEVSTNTSGTEVTITKGCGVTSEGYLVTVPTTTYQEFAPFDPVKERYYDRFVDLATKTKKFDLFELVQSGVIAESIPLTEAFLKDKVVLIFVELLEEPAKNCDPNSCDNKGVNVTVTFRPLLVEKKHADALISQVDGSGSWAQASFKLPELRMRRFDVPATSLASSAAVFEAFLKPLDASFFANLEKALSAAYAIFGTLIADTYPSNPFAGLANRFKFLSSGVLTPEQMLQLQYYYDLFSDVLLAYEELRLAARRASGLCCPDPSLFPRHLLLGEAIPAKKQGPGAYRHYFIPSPILAREPTLAQDLQSLTLRLALLFDKFSVPSPDKLNDKLLEKSLRITPSKFGNVPLSRKSIPYYYSVKSGPKPLYVFWDAEKTRAKAEDRNLSYHASQYNTKDEEIREPLLYDLEPYNFLRIEGHLGAPFRSALKVIQSQRAKYRLPIEVLALGADLRAAIQLLRAAVATGDRSELSSLLAEARACHFQDLEAIYQDRSKGLFCFLCKEMKYYYDLTPSAIRLPDPKDTIPAVPLLKKCDPAFRYKTNSLGHAFELWYATVSKQAYIPAASITASPIFTLLQPALIAVPSEVQPAAAAISTSATVSLQLFLMVMYYVQRVSETLVESLAEFPADDFDQRFADLQQSAGQLKAVLSDTTNDAITAQQEDLLDHLDKLVYACAQAGFKALVAEYRERALAFQLLATLAYYARKCPGIEHKAGVTKGGTFILVYHQKATTTSDNQDFIRIIRTAQPGVSNLAATAASAGATTTTETAATAGKIAVTAAQSARSPLATITKDIELLLRDTPAKSKLDALLEEIPDGAVIADFYLPFICCSECPPVQIVLPPEPTPSEPVTITIEPREFCQTNKGPIEIKVDPAGGKVAGEGVVETAPGVFGFAPAGVNVGDDLFKDVTLTYTREGTSASVAVRVFHQPVAAFDARVAGLTVQTINNSQFASSFFWKFGDGTESQEREPRHDYQQPGVFVITLRAVNGPCEQSFERTVRVEAAGRQCLPVNRIVEDFRKFPELQPGPFGAFRNVFNGYGEVEALIKDIEAAGPLPQAQELQFHVAHKTTSLANRWLQMLQRIILTNVDLRFLALEMYRIILDLLMRIACVQDGDINQDPVPTLPLFGDLILGHATEWRNASGQWDTPQRDKVKQTATEVQSELQRLRAGEVAQKPRYAEALDKLLTLLQ